MVPFASMGYYIYADVSPLGSCYTSAGKILSATGSDDVEMVLPMRDEAEHLHSIDCSPGKVKDDTACKNAGGFCQYVDIEPRRLFSSPVWDMDSVLEQSVIRYTVIRPPPPIVVPQMWRGMRPNARGEYSGN